MPKATKSCFLLVLFAETATAQTDPYLIEVSGGIERLDAGVNSGSIAASSLRATTFGPSTRLR